MLHQLNGAPVSAEWLDRAKPAEVLGLRIPVLAPTDVIATKLRALSERYRDFGQLLPPVRAVREQPDWPAIRAQTSDNPFAAAFLVLAERVGIIYDGSIDEGGIDGAVINGAGDKGGGGAAAEPAPPTG